MTWVIIGEQAPKVLTPTEIGGDRYDDLKARGHLRIHGAYIYLRNSQRILTS
jgi:hypothetical protein